MTYDEAAIITAMTEIYFGHEPYLHFMKYASDKLGKVLMTHELASEQLWDQLKILCTEDFERLAKGICE